MLTSGKHHHRINPINLDPAKNTLKLKYTEKSWISEQKKSVGSKSLPFSIQIAVSFSEIRDEYHWRYIKKRIVLSCSIEDIIGIPNWKSLFIWFYSLIFSRFVSKSVNRIKSVWTFSWYINGWSWDFILDETASRETYLNTSLCKRGKWEKEKKHV